MTSDPQAGRVPPYNMEAELSVLGCILLNNRALLQVKGEALAPESFYVESNRRIFQAMIELDRTGAPIDHVTLGNFMSGKGDLDKIGGPMALGRLTEAVSTVQHVDHYARIIISMAARRTMIYAAQMVVSEGFSHHGDTSEYIASSRNRITIAANSLVQSNVGPRMVDEDLVQIYEEIVEKKMPEGLIRTGLGAIDNITGGLWPGLLYVIAGRPGMGKSAFILNIANNVSMSGKKVLYFTLEDSRKYVIYRMLARYSNIDLEDLMLRRVNSQDQYARIMDAMNTIGGKKPFWIEDASGLTSEQIAQVAAAHKELHGLDFIIVDHLGEINDKGESKTAITTDAARNSRDIAKDLNVPVALLSQLNRDVEKRPNKRPMLSDLRQSGEVEAIARSVWFLYRDGYYMGESGNDRRDMEVIIAKTNHGRMGMVKHYAKLSNMYVRGWDVSTDGLWPADEGKEPVSDNNKPNEQEYFSGGPNSNWQETDKDRDY